ncbi:MAG TPA: zinc-ribbon domain-containing protein [Phycisphaerales bacterium]|nr:zinc-ribbon domain-containing protein [Phycisphaerales bacterium]
MEPQKCTSCGQESQEYAEFCPSCGEPLEGYARPAGFWIRVGAQIIDAVVFIPIMALSFWNTYSLKHTAVLVLTFVPGLVYKPVMESFYGATLGKMACGIRVIDANGKNLSMVGAYVRYFPFLIQAGVTLAGQLILFSSEQFQSAESMLEMSQAQQGNFMAPIGTVVNVLVMLECIVAAFTFRKRALHDMLAESFCVYKES